MAAPRSRRWLTEIKRTRAANRSRVLGYKLSPWEVQALVRSHRQVHPDTLRRAMGSEEAPAPYFNPGEYTTITNPRGGRKMARRGKKKSKRTAKKRPSGQMALPIGGGGGARRRPKRAASRRAAQPTFGATYGSAPYAGGARTRGPAVHGPLLRSGVFDPGSHVTMGRRARGRRRATVYGPAQAPSAYKARRKRKKASAPRKRKGRKGIPRKLGKMPPALARYWARQRKKAAKTSRGTRRRRGGRSPSKKQMRRFVRSIPKKAELRIFSGHKRGKRMPTTMIRNPRGRGGRFMKSNPRRRRRRNPAMDIVGTAKRTIAAAVPAVAGGALISLIDAKLLGDKPLGLRVVGKLLAATAAGVFLKGRPEMAKLIQGAMLGSLGAELMAKVAPGLLGPAPTTGYLVPAGQGMAALIDASGATNSMPSLHGLSGPVLDYNVG